MLYKIQPATINKVVGSVAANKMVDGYMYDRPNSVRILNQRAIRCKLDIVPDIDAIQILKRAKPMDIMSAGTVGGGGILLSDKLLKTILTHTVPMETQIFDAYALHKAKRYHYNYFYIYHSYEDHNVDWGHTEFVNTDIVGWESIGERFNLSLQKRIRKGREFDYVKLVKLVLKENRIKSDIFRLDFSYSGYYVSESLKKAIEEAGCEGVDLIPIDQFGFEVEFV